jgi:hypothetical protein
MKKYKEYKALNESVRQYTGLMARFKKDPSEDNSTLVSEALVEIKNKLDEIMPND